MFIDVRLKECGPGLGQVTGQLILGTCKFMAAYTFLSLKLKLFQS